MLYTITIEMNTRKIYLKLFIIFTISLTSCSIFKSKKTNTFQKETSIKITNLHSERFIEFENSFVLMELSKDVIINKFKRYKNLDRTVILIDSIEKPIKIFESDTNCTGSINEYKFLACIIQSSIMPALLDEGNIRIMDKKNNQEVYEILRIEKLDEYGWHSISYFIKEESKPFFIINISQTE